MRLGGAVSPVHVVVPYVMLRKNLELVINFEDGQWELTWGKMPPEARPFNAIEHWTPGGVSDSIVPTRQARQRPTRYLLSVGMDLCNCGSYLQSTDGSCITCGRQLAKIRQDNYHVFNIMGRQTALLQVLALNVFTRFKCPQSERLRT